MLDPSHRSVPTARSGASDTLGETRSRYSVRPLSAMSPIGEWTSNVGASAEPIVAITLVTTIGSVISVSASLSSRGWRTRAA